MGCENLATLRRVLGTSCEAIMWLLLACLSHVAASVARTAGSSPVSSVRQGAGSGQCTSCIGQEEGSVDFRILTNESRIRMKFEEPRRYGWVLRLPKGSLLHSHPVPRAGALASGQAEASVRSAESGQALGCRAGA
eukprot:scaffold24664_cov135-Isochrysis_galbana.AAC.2